MTITTRMFAGLAAFALVLAGMTALAPSPASAQERGAVAGPLLAGAIFVAVTIATFVLIDENGGDDDETPQSP